MLYLLASARHLSRPGPYTAPLPAPTWHLSRPLHGTSHGPYTAPLTAPTWHLSRPLHGTSHAPYTAPLMALTRHLSRPLHGTSHGPYTAPLTAPTRHLSRPLHDTVVLAFDSVSVFLRLLSELSDSALGGRCRRLPGVGSRLPRSSPPLLAVSDSLLLPPAKADLPPLGVPSS